VCVCCGAKVADLNRLVACVGTHVFGRICIRADLVYLSVGLGMGRDGLGVGAGVVGWAGLVWVGGWAAGWAFPCAQAELAAAKAEIERLKVLVPECPCVCNSNYGF
jgi:hypothetical protein